MHITLGRHDQAYFIGRTPAGSIIDINGQNLLAQDTPLTFFPQEGGRGVVASLIMPYPTFGVRLVVLDTGVINGVPPVWPDAIQGWSTTGILLPMPDGRVGLHHCLVVAGD